MLFRLSARGVGGSVAVRFLRDGRAREASVALTAAPDRPPRDARVIGGNGPLAGLAVARINPAVTEEFDLPYVVDGGVAVTAVRDNAARVGLMPGDVLIAINGRPVETTAAAEAAAAQRTRNWAIDVLRGGERLRLRFLF
jgi:S1-C subfamily serine protease